MIKKINLIIAVFLVLIILFSSSVFAFAVASSYWKGKPLTVYPGQTKTENVFRIQNTGDTDERIIVKIIEGDKIASLEQTDYTAIAGTKNNPVFVTIKASPDSIIGETHLVKMEFKRASVSGGAGAVAMGVGYEMGFDVLITGEPEKALASPISKSNLFWVILIAALIILAIIIWIIIKRR